MSARQLSSESIAQKMTSILHDGGLSSATVSTHTNDYGDTIYDFRAYVGSQKYGRRFTITQELADQYHSSMLESEATSFLRGVHDEYTERWSTADGPVQTKSVIRPEATCLMCGKTVTLKEVVNGSYDMFGEFTEPRPARMDIEAHFSDLSEVQQECVMMFLIGALSYKCDHRNDRNT